VDARNANTRCPHDRTGDRITLNEVEKIVI